MTYNEAYIELLQWRNEQRDWAKRDGFLTRDELARKSYVNKQVKCGEALVRLLSRFK